MKVGATRNSVLQREWSRAICVSRCSVPLELFVEFVLPIEWIGFDRRELRRLSPLLRCCCCCIPVSKIPGDRKFRFHFSLRSFRNRSIYPLSRKASLVFLFFFFFNFFLLYNSEKILHSVVSSRYVTKYTVFTHRERREDRRNRVLAWRRDSRDVPCRYVAFRSQVLLRVLLTNPFRAALEAEKASFRLGQWKLRV